MLKYCVPFIVLFYHIRSNVSLVFDYAGEKNKKQILPISLSTWTPKVLVPPDIEQVGSQSALLVLSLVLLGHKFMRGPACGWCIKNGAFLVLFGFSLPPL